MEAAAHRFPFLAILGLEIAWLVFLAWLAFR